jgi:hypothetical protein
MLIKDAQFEMRNAFSGGFAGQLISGLIWLAAAGLGQWVSPKSGMLMLFFGSMLIFPLTQGLNRLMGAPAKVNPSNGLWSLGTQIAFTVPINFLLVGAVTLYQETWFFPAAMIVVGAHYLPFITLYGMKLFAILAALLILGGAGLAVYGPLVFSLGGWMGGLILIVFAFAGRWVIIRERQIMLSTGKSNP